MIWGARNILFVAFFLQKKIENIENVANILTKKMHKLHLLTLSSLFSSYHWYLIFNYLSTIEVKSYMFIFDRSKIWPSVGLSLSGTPSNNIRCRASKQTHGKELILCKSGFVFPFYFLFLNRSMVFEILF